MSSLPPLLHPDAQARSAPSSGAAPERLASLDALRGMAILAIIGFDGLVAALGELSKAGPAPFREACGFLALQFSHVPWEGLHFYDFVFPLFIFITGTGVALALPGASKAQGRGAVYWKIVRRSLVLYALGVLYYAAPGLHWDDLRYVGVLQRIAVCYLVTALLFMHLRLRAQAFVIAAILVLYWVLLSFVPAPGLPAGSLAPGENLADWFDRTYLPGRLWYGRSDPEGLLSTFPAIATCMIGALAGASMQSRREPRRVALMLIGGGALLVALGLAWSLAFPLIKSLWTSSFALVTGGASAMLLGAAHLALDVRRAFSANWLVWAGRNAILLYMLAGFGLFDAAASVFVGGYVGARIDAMTAPGGAAFAVHALGLAIAIALAGFLHRRRWLIRI